MNNPIKISLILLLPVNNFWGVRYCFDKLGIEYKMREKVTNEEPDSFANFVDGIEVELLIGAKVGSDYIMKDYFSSESLNSTSFVYDYGNANVLNGMLLKATGQYICIIHPFMLLQKGWLRELLSYNQMIDKSGLTCIGKNLKKKNLTSLTDSENNFVHVYEHENDYIEGVFLFNREVFNRIGKFDKNLHGLEFNQYAFRAAACGLKNFYLPDTFSIETIEPEPIPVEAYENFDLSIEEMINKKSWKI